jgi:hypothetical protein
MPLWKLMRRRRRAEILERQRSSQILTSDPFMISEEQAIRSVEMARWAAELQKFWLSSWERHQQDKEPD